MNTAGLVHTQFAMMGGSGTPRSGGDDGRPVRFEGLCFLGKSY